MSLVPQIDNSGWFMENNVNKKANIVRTVETLGTLLSILVSNFIFHSYSAQTGHPASPPLDPATGIEHCVTRKYKVRYLFHDRIHLCVRFDPGATALSVIAFVGCVVELPFLFLLFF